jgi:hypothetical protein
MKTIRVAAAVTLGLGFLVGTGPSSAGGATQQCWLIDARRADSCSLHTSGDKTLRYWQLGDCGRWLAADEGSLLENADPAVPMVAYVHGNPTTYEHGVQTGVDRFRVLRRRAQDQPFHFVIWWWSSTHRDKLPLPRRMRQEAARSDLQAFYLARWIERIEPSVPLSLTGYSFGARVVAGALHLTGGGRLAGRSLDRHPAEPRRPIRAILLGAAIHCDWLLPGRRNGLALTQVEHLLVSTNPCDPAMKWYPAIYRGCSPKPMGYGGPSRSGLPDAERDKIEVLNLSCYVGRSHKAFRYYSASPFLARLPWYTFLEPGQ